MFCGCGLVQSFAQVPQWWSAFVVSTHEVPHTVPVHDAAPMQVVSWQMGVAPLHTLPQEPQCAPLVVSLSQPFLGSPSQSPTPAPQLEMEHAPLLQVKLATLAPTHAPHVVGPQPNAGSSTPTHLPPHDLVPAAQPDVTSPAPASVPGSPS